MILPDVVDPIAPLTSECVSGWLTCHSPFFSEQGQVRKHMTVYVYGICRFESLFGSVYINCILLHNVTLEVHYLYFYLVQIQNYDCRFITTVLSCLKCMNNSFYIDLVLKFVPESMKLKANTPIPPVALRFIIFTKLWVQRISKTIILQMLRQKGLMVMFLRKSVLK